MRLYFTCYTLVFQLYITGILCYYRHHRREQSRSEPKIVNEIGDAKHVGETAELKCTISNLESTSIVYWYKTNTGVKISQNDKITAPNNRIWNALSRHYMMYKYAVRLEHHPTINQVTYRLMIRQLQTKDAGKYGCIVKTIHHTGYDGTSSSSKTGHLEVKDEPAIVEEIRTEVKIIGQTGQLECTVSNKKPSTTVNWHKLDKSDIIISEDDKIINSNELVQTGPSGNKTVHKYAILTFARETNGRLVTFRLVINHLTAEDIGMYMCKVRYRDSTNTEKSRYKYGELYVQSPPKINSTSSTNTVELDSGEKLILECKAKGRPFPVIKWTRGDGRPLRNGNMASIGERYVIENVTLEDRGVYRCMANNNITPPDSHDANFFIRRPPAVKAILNSVALHKDSPDSVSLECEVSGYPQPVVEWWIVNPGTKASKRKIEQSNKYIIDTSPKLDRDFDDNLLTTLIIENVTSDDYADYFCLATSRLGAKQTSITLYG